MFKTALREVEDPERHCLTPGPTVRTKLRISLQRGHDRDSAWGNYSSLRPHTSPLTDQKNYETLNSTARKSHWMNLSSIDVVEDELESKYKGEMCGYLRRKLHKVVGKRQQDIPQNRYAHSSIEAHPAENPSHSTIGPLDRFYSTFHPKSGVLVEKVVDEAYVSNAKEHILRLIHRKREQQVEYKQLSKSIRIRREGNQERRATSLRQQFKVKAVEKEQWDKQWRASASNQKSRYRNRLKLKYNHQSNSPLLASFSK